MPNGVSLTTHSSKDLDSVLCIDFQGPFPHAFATTREIVTPLGHKALSDGHLPLHERASSPPSAKVTNFALTRGNRFVFSNAGALAAAKATHIAGAGAAVQGVAEGARRALATRLAFARPHPVPDPEA